MLVPYNVDKRTKLVPFITYGLIAANIFFFLLSISISNYHIKEDRIEGNNNKTRLLKNSPEERAIKEYTAIRAERGDPLTKDEVEELRQEAALTIAARQIGTLDGYKQYWQIEHLNDFIVLEPHHSVMNTLAYRPNTPSPIARFL